MAAETNNSVDRAMNGTGTGAVVEERNPTTMAPAEGTIEISSQPQIQSTSRSDSESTPTESIPATSLEINNSPSDEHTSSVINTRVPPIDPPAYSRTPPPPSPSIRRPSSYPPSPSTRTPSPPPPPLPPSPVISPIRTFPATRPASFPLLSSTNPPSNAFRPYTVHLPRPSTVYSPTHSIAIDIFPDPDADPSSHDEPLPTYSRYPKRGEAHCIGEMGDPEDRSVISDSMWDGRSRMSGGGKGICFCGLYMRTVIAGIVLLIVACVIAGGMVWWQMKANLDKSVSPKPDSTSDGGPHDGGNVDYWTPPDQGNDALLSTITSLVGTATEVPIPDPSSTPTKLILTMRLPNSTPTPTAS